MSRGCIVGIYELVIFHGDIEIRQQMIAHPGLLPWRKGPCGINALIAHQFEGPHLRGINNEDRTIYQPVPALHLHQLSGGGYLFHRLVKNE